ncbi:deoxyribonucleoside 5' monophosphate phosphatase [Rhodothermus phage RM378]|uniref:deoxyribonucleoside 5' monophosphate phosphatase n=1 Tax=Rhodothermus phage RM378 TaxID=148943 RepID=UPI000018F62D|nr:deoxyribonucleoside 5' monophosphate phosphatase [Rhodothermus phage RM378]
MKLELHPSLHRITIEDVAARLSNICRYQGNGGKYFYSVLEHSLIVYDVAREVCSDALFGYCVLMHDSSECVLGDFNGVIKSFINKQTSALSEIEELLDDFFITKFLPNRAKEIYLNNREVIWKYIKMFDRYVIKQELQNPLIHCYFVFNIEDNEIKNIPDFRIPVTIGDFYQNSRFRFAYEVNTLLKQLEHFPLIEDYESYLKENVQRFLESRSENPAAA